MQELSRKYKHTMNSAINKQKREFSNQLKKMRFNKPKEFWKHFKDQGKNNNVEANPDDLFNHFKNAGEANYTDSDSDILNPNPNTSNANDYILNNDISIEEVRIAISKLSNGKSPGDDMILNEYIKQSSDILLPIYVNIFNAILTSGI